MPWNYSEAPGKDDPGVPNMPSPEGAELGRMLARMAEREEAAQRATLFPNMLPRCDDCALRAGTLPNQCAETLMDVVKCVAEGQPFYCHKGVRDGNAPRRLCTGWAVLQRAEIARVLRSCAEGRGPFTLPSYAPEPTP
jgi:hypothetical protein